MLADKLFFRTRIIQLRIKRILHNIRLLTAIHCAQHTDFAWQIVIDLHKAHSNKTVEPRIGNLFDYAVIGSQIIALLRLFLNSLCKAQALRNLHASDSIRLSRTDIKILLLRRGLRQSVCNPLFRNTQQACLVFYILNELCSCPDCIIFYCCLIHVLSPFVYIFLSEIISTLYHIRDSRSKVRKEKCCFYKRIFGFYKKNSCLHQRKQELFC